jgi:tetratricopeptide (TPR) repeat protein
MSPRCATVWPVLLALVVGARATAQMVSVKERDYWGVVAQYVKGERTEALAKIGAWNGKDLDAVVDSIEDLAKAASKCRACEASQGFEALPLRAAVLLHAERDRADRTLRIKERDGEPSCLASAQGSAAERLAKVAASQPGGRDFVARFSVTMSSDFRSLLCFLGAARWAEFGLEVAPGDTRLLVARGLARETIGTTGYTEPVPTTTYDARGRAAGVGLRSSEVKKDRELNEAREAFEKALSIDPNQDEASLRLGRVWWRLGRGREAEEALRKALNAKDGAIRYLGHLFLGQCLEDTRNLDGAIAQYRTALSLRPDSQIGAVALANALSLRGNAEGAREVLEPVLARAGTRREVDPYWLYLTGAPDLGEALLNTLRVESIR